MSQVRKFQNGGNTPEKKSKHDNRYGHYIVDGVTYDVNDDFLRDYAASANKFGDNSTSVLAGDILNTLRSGKDVNIDTLNNSISGVSNYSFDKKDLAKSQEMNERGWTRKTQRQANRNARRNSFLHQFHQGIKNLGSIKFNNPVEKPQENITTAERIGLFGDRGWFDYNTDADGNKIYSTAPGNASAENYLSQIQDALSLTEEEAKKKYNWEDYETNWTDLQNWKTRYGQDYDWNALLSRIKSNQINQADEDLLRTLGFDKDQTQETSNENQTSITRSYANSGLNDDELANENYYVRKGEDGNSYLFTVDAEGNPQLVTDSIYLKGSPWARGSQWDGGAVYGGRLYTADQVYDTNSTVGRVIQSQLFNQLRTANDPEAIRQAALNSPWKVYGTENPYNISENNTFIAGQHYLKGFTDLFNNGTYYWTDITNQYNAPEGTTILSYYNQNNRDRDNSLREQYAVYHNGKSQIFENQEALQNYLSNPEIGISKSEQYNYGNPISQYKYIINNGAKFFHLGERYLIPGDENSKYDIYRDERGTYYVNGNNGKLKQLQGRAILEKIKNGTVSAQEIKNGFASEDNRWWSKYANNSGRLFGINVGTRNKNPYDNMEYDEYFGFYKKGGKIQKNQFGGMFHQGHAGEMKQHTPVERKIGQPQKLNADKKLKTGADSANIAAGVLDAAGLATSWLPGVGTAIGVLGSLARLSADIQKDGFQWKDLGNFGINLGLDALTLLPGVGAVGKAAKTGVKAAKAAGTASKAGKILNKTAKVLNRAQPVIATAGTAAGASQIAGAINDAKEGEFTSESMGNLLSGLGNTAAGITGLGKLYRTAKTVKKFSKPIEAKDRFEVKSDDGKVSKALKKGANKLGNWAGTPGRAVKNSTLRLMYQPGKVEKLIENNWQVLARSKNKYANKLAAEYLNKTGAQTINDIEYSGTAGPRWTLGRFKLNRQLTTSTPTPTSSTSSLVSKTATSSSSSSITPTPITITPEFKAKQELVRDIRKVKSSSDLRQLLYKINSNWSKKYDNVLKKNPYLKDEIIQHINNDRWYHGSGIDDFIKQYDIKFKKGGKIIKAQPGAKAPTIGYINYGPAQGATGYYSTAGMGFQWPVGQGTQKQQWYTADPNGQTTPYASGYHFMYGGQQQTQQQAPVAKDSKSAIETPIQEQIPEINGGTINAAIVSADRTTMSPSIAMPTQATTQMGQSLNIPEVQQRSNPNSTLVTSTNDIINKSKGVRTGNEERSFNLNINPDDIIGGLDLLRNLTSNTKMFNRLKDANKAVYKEMPTEIYDRYQDHITPVYQEMANNQRSYIPTSADALTNYAIRQSRQDTADNILAEGRLKASEQYSNYLNNDLAARRQYAGQRQETAFYNRQQMANKIMRDAQIDQMRDMANAQSISNFVTEMRNKIAGDRSKQQGFMQQQAEIGANNAYTTALNDELEGLRKQYQALDENTRKTIDFDSWALANHANEYNAAVTTAANERLKYIQGTWPQFLDYFRAPKPVSLASSTPISMTATQTYKSGGKTKKAEYSRRHYGPKPDEAIWIQQNKATAEAIKKLHDNVIKLFMVNLK